MIWFNNLLLFFCLVIQWKCLNSLIFPSKLMIDGEHEQLHQRPPSVYIVKINNPTEDTSAEKIANGGGLVVQPAKEPTDENWDSKNKNRFQLWRINGQNNNKKIIFSRPLMWQSHRSFPSICMAGPSMFRNCCNRLKELSNDTESMPQFCFFGRCCKNLTNNTSSTVTPTPFHVPHPSISISVSNPLSILSSEQHSSDAVSTPSLTENPVNETSSSQRSDTTKAPASPSPLPTRTVPLTPESKKLRINEKKINNFKGGNKNCNENVNFQSRTKVNILPENDEQSSLGENSNEIEALAATACKLIKMSGKGKNFLSREDATDKDEKSGESGSDEGSADDSLRFDGDGSASEEIDESKNKSETTRQPKTASSSLETNYSELDEPVSGGDKSNEPLEIDDDVSKYSEESVEDISKHIKPHGKSQTKQKTETTKKEPIVTPKPKNITLKTKPLSNITTNSLTDTTLITKDQTTIVLSTKDNRITTAKSSNVAVTTLTLSTTTAKSDSTTNLKTESKTPKNTCPRNKGGPNCNVDITGAISGYGYYVYLHHRPLSRSDSVRECATRNMSLAFLTNHNEDKLLRRIISTNTTYWIGLTKELTKGELKSRFRWEDESDAGTYITRYVVLDNEGQEKRKGKEDPPITSCTLKLANGKMKVECLVGQTQLLAYPICMYRPPALI